MRHGCNEKGTVGAAAKLHDSVVFRPTGADSADAERQGRPEGAAGTGRSSGHGNRIRGATNDAGSEAGGAVAERAGRGARRSEGQLLRAGRPFAEGDDAGGADAQGAGCECAAADDLSSADAC
ncbi:hypothetical protein D3C84_601950 [compost metagenome]